MDQPQTSTSTEPSPSPLAEATPDSISELFARDPQEWTDAEWLRAIDQWRKVRESLDVNQKPAKAPKAAAQKLEGSVEDILGELGLG